MYRFTTYQVKLFYNFHIINIVKYLINLGFFFFFLLHSGVINFFQEFQPKLVHRYLNSGYS